MSALRRILAEERKRHWKPLALACLAAAIVTASSVLLLGLSGWFITAAALAGLAGPVAANAFNYMLPAVAIRLFAILRTGGRYAERVFGHDAALRALADLRPALFAAILAGPVSRVLALTVGDASTRMVQDVDAVEAHFVRLSAPWGAGAAVLGGMVLLLPAGLAPAAATAVVFSATLLAGWGLSGRAATDGRGVQRATAALKERYASLIEASAELRAYGLDGWAAERIAAEGQALLDAQARVTAWGGWFALLQAGAPALAAMTALGLSLHDRLPVAAMAALGAAMTVEGAGALLRSFEVRGSLAESEARLDAVLHAPNPVVGEVVDLRDHPAIVLTHPVAHLAPGEVVGITGPSGSGKTTILERLIGLRATPATEIWVDGADLAMIVHLRACGAASPMRRKRRPCSPEPYGRISSWPVAQGRRMRRFGRHCMMRRWMSASARCHPGSTAGLERTARGSRAARGGGSASPAPISGLRPGCCWMSRPRAWMLALRRLSSPGCGQGWRGPLKAR